MKRKLLTCLAFVFASGMLFASGDAVNKKSGGNSYPMPFQIEGDNPTNSPAITTGYYLVDNDDEAGDKWRPKISETFVDTTTQPGTWFRITSGPNQFPLSHWETNPNGHSYFRNPNNTNDSTDDVFAGPIPIGFPFYFNGIRYDSVYVGSNGMIGLSNRRYFYDQNGDRIIPDGQLTAYDDNRDDNRPTLDDQGNPDPLADGLDDPTPDDFGFRYIASGNTSNMSGGLREWNNDASLGNLGGSLVYNQAPVLAPLWDDHHLSQWSSEFNIPEDYSRVYIKRSLSADRLIIYYVNLAPIGGKAMPSGGTMNFAMDNRAMRMNMQIMLDRRDSSVSYTYRRFNQPLIIFNNRPNAPSLIYAMNSTIGVHGFARYPNGSGGWSYYKQYTQFVHNSQNSITVPGVRDPLRNDLVIKFKQWKNVLRTVGIKYLVRDKNTGLFTKEVSDPTDYELLIGDNLLGAIQPVAKFQNLTNDIQGPNGVNFQEQDLSFRTRFRIQNEIIGPDTVVYNRQVCVDSFALANSDVSGVQLVNWKDDEVPFNNATMNGVPPYGFVEVKFPAFETNQFIENQIGRLRSYVIAEPYKCASLVGYNDCWPFDDTTNVRLFGIRVIRTLDDDGSNFAFSRREGNLPSPTTWVSIGAEQVNGDANTYNPPPPRSVEEATNNEFQTLASPVIRLDRFDGGTDLGPPGQRGGDELISFPIDLTGRERAVLSFSYQRTGNPSGSESAPYLGLERGWSDQTTVGPESRVINNGNPFGESRRGDDMFLEFANPSNDGYENVTNIEDNGYGKHPRLDDPGEHVSNNPAFTVFGGGGFRRGFHELNFDSALLKQPEDQGLRVNVFDDGKDFDFTKVFLPIPTYIMDSLTGAPTFRFRFRVDATNDQQAPTWPADDQDFFYIDNVRLLFPTETPDLEMASVKVKWPYTETPASQAQNLPVTVKVSNNSEIAANSFAVQVIIRREADVNLDTLAVYCRSLTIPQLPANTEVEFPLPNWNAQQTTPGKYILSARLNQHIEDPQPRNDSTHGTFDLVFGETFAYDPVDNVENNVEDTPNPPGKGLNLSGYSMGGSAWSQIFETGADGGNSSGQIAMKFTLQTQDTIQGFQAYFAGLNADILNIRFAVYEDQGGSPGAEIPGTLVYKQRGWDEKDDRSDLTGRAYFDEYTTYLLPSPVTLQPGDYWIAVAQLGSEGFELGASKARMGMVVTDFNTQPPMWGAGGFHILADKNLRRKNNQGQLINQRLFAYQNTVDRGQWTDFTPTQGNPGYAHLPHNGLSAGEQTFSRGSWIPLLRAYFGERSFANPPIYTDWEICELFEPVTIADFAGQARPPHGIELFWETKSEQENAGFYVARRVLGTSNWSDVEFVEGAGNSNSPLTYSVLDAEVEKGTTYEYHLRMVDYDGTTSHSGTIQVKYDFSGEVTLLPNQPNPFNEETTLRFAMSQQDFVKLEVLDILGNSVRTLKSEDMTASASHTVVWDGRDNRGVEMPAGTYIYRLTVGNNTQTRTMNLVR